MRGAVALEKAWLTKDTLKDVAVYVIWSPQLGAEEKCSENSFATMRNELIRSKPATRNRIVRMSSILQVLLLVGATAPNAKLSRRFQRSV